MFDSKTLAVKTIDLVDQSSRNVFLKKVFFAVLVVAAGFLTSGYVFKLMDPAGGSTRIDQGLTLFLAVVWLYLVLIFGMVFSWFEFSGVVLASFFIVFFPFFRFLDLKLSLIFMLLAVLLAFSARQASKSMAENSIKVKPNDFLSAALVKIVLILSLIMSLSFWSSRFSQGFSLKPSDIRGVTSGLAVFYPGYNEKTTIGELVGNLADKQSQGLLKNLSPSGISLDAFKDSIKNEAGKSFLNQLSNLLGRQVSPAETIPDLILSWIGSYYDNLADQTKKIASYAILLIVFGFWLSLFQVFSFLLYGVFWLVWKGLFLLKIIKVGIVTVEKEILTV